jgi:hypothetical protein
MDVCPPAGYPPAGVMSVKPSQAKAAIISITPHMAFPAQMCRPQCRNAHTVTQFLRACSRALRTNLAWTPQLLTYACGTACWRHTPAVASMRIGRDPVKLAIVGTSCQYHSFFSGLLSGVNVRLCGRGDTQQSREANGHGSSTNYNEKDEALTPPT